MSGATRRTRHCGRLCSAPSGCRGGRWQAWSRLALVCGVFLVSPAEHGYNTFAAPANLWQAVADTPFPQEARVFLTTADGLPSNDVDDVTVDARGLLCIRVGDTWHCRRGDDWQHMPQSPATARPDRHRRDVAERASGLAPAKLPWSSRVDRALGMATLSDGTRSWLPQQPLVVHDADGVAWIADQHGVARVAATGITLFTPADGLPSTDFTAAAVAADGRLYLGTPHGLIHFDGQHWAYRQGLRWLPDDGVRGLVAVGDDVYVATAGGLARLVFTPLTLERKAALYQAAIDRHHRRTEFGYVIEAQCPTPGSTEGRVLQDSDNDGLWTSMYGAGECFAFAATGDPAAKQRATQAFEALRFLSIAPRGGRHPAPRGFIARTVVPTSEPDPNLRPGYTLEGQRRSQQQGDALWRIYEPRWPKTEDGRYWWKSDTSSDELDGHYFFYGLYYDLVADSEAEKARVREIVRDNIEHLISHGFRMHDHAGPTRWANYAPESLNHDLVWAPERGLNSLSMLSYLATAAHITGDERYLETASMLRDEHGYAQNVMNPKLQNGIGSGNQSDDEMAFMAFYNLLAYEPDAAIRDRYRLAFFRAWQLEAAEQNPFFNLCYAVFGIGHEHTDPWSTRSVEPTEGWLQDTLATLRRFPLDRFNWAHQNANRADLLRVPGDSIDVRDRFLRTDGFVIPVDERHFNHWNHNPWQPNSGGDGRTLASGTVYLLPYWMARHHGFLAGASSHSVPPQ